MPFHASHPITLECSGLSFTRSRSRLAFEANFAEINREKSPPQDDGHATDGVRPGKVAHELTCVL